SSTASTTAPMWSPRWPSGSASPTASITSRFNRRRRGRRSCLPSGWFAGPSIADVLEVRQASVVFGGARVLGPIDLAVERGRHTVLIGPSGSGKSTLIRLFNGLVTPTSGQVL